jgi:hypothetical protein
MIFPPNFHEVVVSTCPLPSPVVPTMPTRLRGEVTEIVDRGGQGEDVKGSSWV